MYEALDRGSRVSIRVRMDRVGRKLDHSPDHESEVAKQGDEKQQEGERRDDTSTAGGSVLDNEIFHDRDDLVLRELSIVVDVCRLQSTRYLEIEL